MKTEFQVNSGIKPTEFRTMSESVAASEHSRDTNRAKLEKLKDNCVKEYQFNGKELAVRFDNNYYLTVSAGDNSINWDVVLDRPSINDSLKVQEEIFFVFPSGTRHLWNWKEVLDSILGKKILLSPSNQYLFFLSKEVSSTCLT